MDTERTRTLLQDFAFQRLFIEELGWNQPDESSPFSIESDHGDFQAHTISELSGVRVYLVSSEEKSIPNLKTQAAISKKITQRSHENLIIFVDSESSPTQSLWYWGKRENSKTLPRRHHYVKGQPGDLFLSKLAAMVVDLSELDEQGNIPITEVANRVRSALDVERVTKRFFTNFQERHLNFLDHIKGIADDRDRRWYASVILNRLMFIWFLQKKSFVDGQRDSDFLRDKLNESVEQEKDTFYSHFLRDLFFEGFAKPASKRAPVGTIPLGDIPYLNGGLFLPHGIESRVEGGELLTEPFQKIRICDKAFAQIFDLFAQYTWHLNDTPGGKDNEINPDVLGHIFEKYINQKAFGAYYTLPEITEYLCEQTIHQLVIDAANEGFEASKKLHQQGILKGSSPRKFASIDDLIFHADGKTCKRLLQDVLPRLSLLDPACGSGAFLVAAMRTLLNLYTALFGRCQAIGERSVLQWIETEQKNHKAPLGYWLKKKIITENLYGVDIMEEATEIAKLRLFLTLVASAESRDQLEPLPNIEFNLIAGNSLIGLLNVDASAFDKSQVKRQATLAMKTRPSGAELGMEIEVSIKPSQKEREGEFLASKHSKKYSELLQEKNRRIEIYKRATADFKDLVAVRQGIEEIKNEAREVLNGLLFDAFRQLGIDYQQATWDENKGKEGKSKKRDLAKTDILRLHPFHWAYEFDDIIIKRGGFDAIITNPPWEIFKPNAKEFFQEHSGLISKNKMRIEDFKTEKKALLRDPEIRKTWLDYLSSYPHLSEWFRNAPQFSNQIGKVNGRKVGSDLNLYKLFLEQCTRLLRDGGRCGIVIPSGIYTDLGAKQLRSMLFEENRITALFGFENRRKIFDNVDSRFKFVVLSFEKGGTTDSFPVAFMRHDVSDLATFPNPDSLHLDTILIEKLSPGSLSMMEFKSSLDIDIAEKMLRFPLLGEQIDDAWNVKFTSEFHMTNDSGIFKDTPGENRLPLYEGKMIWQFKHDKAQPRYWVEEEGGRASVLGRIEDEGQTLDYQDYRLGFRDIARNTDTRTLISTVIPSAFHGNKFPTIITHSKTNGQKLVELSTQLYLCSILNSFVLDWMIRQKVTTTLNYFYMFQLALPRLDKNAALFRPLAERAARLIGTSPEFDALLKEVFGQKATHRSHGVTAADKRQRLRAEIDAIVAQLYELTEDEFAHILATFPLVDQSTIVATRNAYRDLDRGLIEL